MAGMEREKVSLPGSTSLRPSAGAATASMTRTEAHRVATGCRRAGRRSAVNTRPFSGFGRFAAAGAPRRARRAAFRAARRSARWPSLTSRAGSTVSELSTATATTRIVPVASEEKMTSVAR